MPDPIATLTTTDGGKTYEVPKTRIGSAQDARDIVATLKRADQQWRSQRRAKINGCINGNRPWSQAKQAQQGRKDQTNFNLREAEGFVLAAKTPYYDLIFEVDRFAQLWNDYSDDLALQQEWSEKVEKRYHETLDDWDGMDAAFQRSQYQMVVHGAGPMVWENERDWRSKSRMAGQILVPDNASADVEEWETAAIPRPYSPSELWNIIKNESAATAAKWNVPEVKKAIMNAAPESMQKEFGNTWEKWEAEIRKGCAGFDNKSKQIFVADLFQKEFSGKISHFIILDTGMESGQPSNDPNAATTSEKDENVGFLYRKLDRFDCFTNIVNGFLYDVGPDGQWHSVKGAGPKILDFCDVSNRLTCKMIDGAMAASGLIVKPKNVKALQETAMTYLVGGVALHPDYDVEQHRISDNLQSPLLVKRDLQNTLQSNTGSYRQRLSDENHEPTARQAELNASHAAVLGRGDVNRYYRALDRWHRETLRRMLIMGKKLYSARKEVAPTYSENKKLTPNEQGALDFFKGAVEEDGVPEEAMDLKYFCRIKATRSIGQGSAQMRDIISQQFMGLLPMMDERSRNTALRMRASALGGQTAADLLFPRYGTPQMADAQISLATLENNVLRMPSPEIAVSPEQNHVVHFKIHDDGLTKHAQEVQAGQSYPQLLMVHFDNAGPHMHDHMMRLEGDPTRKQQFDAMMEQWQVRSKQADQLRQQLEEAQAAREANQPQQQPDPKLIADMAKVRGELEIKRMSQMGKLKLQADKQAADIRRKDIQTASTIRRENAKAAQVEPIAA